MAETILIATAVPAWVTIMFFVILAGLILCLALEEKLHAKKSIIAAAFAVFSLLLGTACGIFSFEEVVIGSHEAHATEQPIELEYFDSDDQETHSVTIEPEEQHPANDQAAAADVAGRDRLLTRGFPLPGASIRR